MKRDSEAENKKMLDNQKSAANGIVQNRILRLFFLISGWIFVGLAALGVIVPLLPTTPFLILAALCFYKSSQRFYAWLYTNRLFGKYLLDYREKKGVPVRVKIYTSLLMWVTLIISISLVHLLWIRLVLIAIGVAVTVHLILIRTKKTGRNQRREFLE